MTVSRQSRKKIQITLFLSIILTAAAIFTGCDSLGGNAGDGAGANSGDGTGTSENGGLVYLGGTTPLNQLVFEEYGLYGSVYNTDILLYSDGANLAGGSGVYIYLEMFFSSAEVTAGNYSWTSDSVSPGANTFSDSSAIFTLENGIPTYSDQISSGQIVISISGSIYTITGNVTTTAGNPANFTYTGPVDFVFSEE